jgi:hypothetical protein
LQKISKSISIADIIPPHLKPHLTLIIQANFTVGFQEILIALQNKGLLTLSFALLLGDELPPVQVRMHGSLTFCSLRGRKPKV